MHARRSGATATATCRSLALDPRTGKLWEAEHGPRGGDEINLPRAGQELRLADHHPRHQLLRREPYSGSGGHCRRPAWSSPTTSGPKFAGAVGHGVLYRAAGSKWNDSLFLGALADGSLIRLTLDGEQIIGEERLLDRSPAASASATCAWAADGKVYVLTDEDNGKLLRLDPPPAADIRRRRFVP